MYFKRLDDLLCLIYDDDPSMMYIMINVIENKDNMLMLFDVFKTEAYLGSCVEVDVHSRKLCVPKGGA